MRTMQQAGGFVRNLDSLGRVVLPMEWRRTFGLHPGDPMELIPGRDGTMMIQRYSPGGACTFCGTLDEVRHFAGRPICRPCAAQIGPVVAR